MKEFAIEEAGAQFNQLLAMGKSREEIRLTRYGEVVVEMMPPGTAEQQTRADRINRTLAEIRERMREEGIQPVDKETILEWVHEGRC